MHNHDTDTDTVDKTTLPPAGYDAKRPEGLTPAQEAKWEADNPQPAGTDYDTPPSQWVPGTVVPADTAPEDMTDAEYVQWCFENRMPYWAIKKEIVLRNPPIVSGLNPSTAAIGDPSFTLVVSGENFIADSVIVFAGQDEPTQLNEDGTLSTGVNMGVWHGPDELEVRVRNGSMLSEPSMFTFTPAPEAARANDEDEPGYDDDGKPVRKARKKK